VPPIRRSLVVVFTLASSFQGKGILERHFMVSDHPVTFVELVEMTRNNPRRSVEFLAGELTFTMQGEGFQDLDAYKDHYAAWGEVKAKVIRPDQECTNGIIHVVDTVFIDNSPPWSVGRAAANRVARLMQISAVILLFFILK
jgi:hypothetical protein